MNNIIRSILKALLAAGITAAVLILIFAFAAFKSNDSTANVELFGRISFFAAVFAGALVAAKTTDKNALGTAFIFGGIFTVISYAVSLAMGGGSLSKVWVMYLGAAAMCLIGGFVGSKRKPGKPKSFKKYKKARKSAA